MANIIIKCLKAKGAVDPDTFRVSERSGGGNPMDWEVSTANEALSFSHSYAHTHTDTHTHAQTHTDTDTHKHRHTHTQTQTHKHRHTHARTPLYTLSIKDVGQGLAYNVNRL